MLRQERGMKWQEAGIPELIKRLDAVIGLLVVTLPQPEGAAFYFVTRSKLLDAAGLAPSEIACIVDRLANSVTSELTKIRGNGKVAKKSRKKE